MTYKLDKISDDRFFENKLTERDVQRNIADSRMLDSICLLVKIDDLTDSQKMFSIKFLLKDRDALTAKEFLAKYATERNKRGEVV